jgi:RNA polymerase sigma-70 factor (ECF subfamily)
VTGLLPGEETQSPPGFDERRLVEALKTYDDSAIRLVYRMHADGIFRYALYQLGDRTAAEDVAGETFVRLLNSIDRYEYRGLPLQAYLYRIAQNLVVDQRRRRGRFASLDAVPEGALSSPNPAVLAEQRLGWGDLRSALDELTDNQRQVILLKFVEDLDNRQVADVIGKNEGSVKSLQHRALASLRRILERRGRVD